MVGRNIGFQALLIAAACVGCGETGADGAATQSDDASVEESDIQPSDADAQPVDGSSDEEVEALEETDVTGVEDVESYPLDAPGPGFHRLGARILDNEGRTIVLHGVNASNATKGAEDHLTWHERDDFEALAAVGFNSIRLLIHWAAIMPEPGDIDTEFLSNVGQRLDWAEELGLLVIFDMHQDLFGYGFGGNGAPEWACDQSHYDNFEPVSPWWMNYTSADVQACFDGFYGDDETFEYFESAWRAVAAEFGDHPAVVGFDLLNEPHWGSTSLDRFIPDVWQPRQDQLAEAILSEAPNRIVFYEAPPLQTTMGVSSGFEPPAQSQVGFAPHYYHPTVHEGADYTPGMLGDIERAMENISMNAGEFGGAPIWVGEFGGYTSNATLPDFFRALLPEMVARGYGWAVWSDDRGGGFSLRDGEGAFYDDSVSVLTHPYAQRVPGEISEQRVDFEEGRFEATFVWSYSAALLVWTGAGNDLQVTCDSSGQIVCEDGAYVGLSRCPASQTAFGKTCSITVNF